MQSQNERWLFVAAVGGIVLTAAWLMAPPRFEMRVVDGAVFRLDRWSGRVSATRLSTLRKTDWVSFVLTDGEEAEETEKLRHLLSEPHR